MYQRFQNLLKSRETRPIVYKAIGFLVLFGVTFYGAFGMAKSFFSVYGQKSGKERELKNIEERIKIINSESATNSEFQKEKALREKLYMVKPGEDLIIVVPEDKDSKKEPKRE